MKLIVDYEDFLDLYEWDKVYGPYGELIDIMRKMGTVAVEVWKVHGEYGPYWTWKAYLYYMEKDERVMREDCAADTVQAAMRDAHHAIINSTIDDWTPWYDL